MEKVLNILWERQLSKTLWNTKKSKQKSIFNTIEQTVTTHLPKSVQMLLPRAKYLLYQQFHTNQLILFTISISIVLYSLLDCILLLLFTWSTLLFIKNVFLCILSAILIFYLIQESNNNAKQLAKTLSTTPDAMQKYFNKLEVYMRIQKHISQLMLDTQYLGYDPIKNHPSLEHFKPIKMGTQCVFAKSSIVWAHYPWKNGELSLRQNVIKSIPKLIEMLNIGCHPEVLDLNGRHLDGFLFVIQNKQLANTPEGLGKVVNMILTTLSENDPSKIHCLDDQRRKFVNNKSWFFQFNSYPIFITTMASCYPETHSRYAFGVQDTCFVLLQPEYSFMLHNLGPDHPYNETVWDNPTDIRDKIRVNFKVNGRPYKVPNTIFYPTATQMVESLNSYEDNHEIIEWWKEYPTEDILHEGYIVHE